MAVLLPTLQRARKQAKTVGCQAKLRQVGLIFAAYVAENNGRFAPGTDKVSVQRFGYSGFMPMLIGVSSGHKDLLRCPMAYRPKEMPDLAKAEAESSQLGMEDRRHVLAVGMGLSRGTRGLARLCGQLRVQYLRAEYRGIRVGRRGRTVCDDRRGHNGCSRLSGLHAP